MEGGSSFLFNFWGAGEGGGGDQPLAIAQPWPSLNLGTFFPLMRRGLGFRVMCARGRAPVTLVGRGLALWGRGGAAPFSKRETLRCLCPSLRKGMEGGPRIHLSVALGGTDPTRQSPPFLCYVCAAHVHVHELG